MLSWLSNLFNRNTTVHQTVYAGAIPEAMWADTLPSSALCST
jgi:hypothetical protein